MSEICETVEMARLPTMKSPLAAAPSRLSGPRGERERARLQRREKATPWRAWYDTPAWKALRAATIAADSAFCPDIGAPAPRCRRTGVWLIGKAPAWNSPVVDHIVPHEGDERLFFDPRNLQTVAKGWHDKIKQARERAKDRASFYPSWLRPSVRPLTIVCGPPASGKSSFVRERAVAGDVVIDLDVIASEISGEPLHRWSRERWLNAALFRRNDLLGDLSRPETARQAWFVVSEPKPDRREWWSKTLRPARMVVLAVAAEECLRRSANDAGRDHARDARQIAAWWAEYAPRSGEETIV